MRKLWDRLWKEVEERLPLVKALYWDSRYFLALPQTSYLTLNNSLSGYVPCL